MREDGRSRGEASDCSDDPEQRKTRYVVKDGKCLAKVMALLNKDLEVTFCGKVVALLHSCFVTVHQRCKELAREKAMTRFYAVRIRELPIVDGSVFRSFTWLRSSTSFTECEQKRLRTNDGGTFC